MILEKELETYKRELPNLHDQEGKFVLIQDDKIIDVFGTYEDALKKGYEQFGLKTPFLVKQIQAVQEIQSVTRDLTFPCPT
ncbi:MAG: hypothetical protein L0229_31750 [Blastocatellia bacterium]|nr:hypothetical protein [Blastocatellia bacterium]